VAKWNTNFFSIAYAKIWNFSLRESHSTPQLSVCLVVPSVAC
jgi:hypothetical protein